MLIYGLLVMVAILGWYLIRGDFLVILFRTLAKFVHEMESIFPADCLNTAHVSLSETKEKWCISLLPGQGGRAHAARPGDDPKHEGR